MRLLAFRKITENTANRKGTILIVPFNIVFYLSSFSIISSIARRALFKSPLGKPPRFLITEVSFSSASSSIAYAREIPACGFGFF